MEQQMLMATEVESAELIRCIDACERAHRACLHVAMTHCLEQGGEHVEPPHFRLMLVCADICRAAADAMLAHFSMHEDICAVCARVCRECADSCRRIGDLDQCVDACEQCAASCERIAGTSRAGVRAYGASEARRFGDDTDRGMAGL